MQYDVLNRWTGKVQFTATIECDADASAGFKLGLAVKWGRKNGANLSDANLSDANLSDAVLRGAVLRGAVLRGANLSDANLSDADLRGAVLRGADLSGAVLRGADLRGANLSGANLSDANLSDADLRGAPKIKNIHQAVYAAASAPDALDMGQWHNACGTAHCRAGWAVVLAGEAGKALEAKIGTPAAATLIYLASDPELDRFPSFYCGNAEALADMKARAEAEAAKAVQS
jgi:hypothetical protein